MRVQISGPVTHLCPFADEVDTGTVTLSVIVNDDEDVIELHSLRAFLGSFHTRRITHEALTLEVAAAYPQANVSTAWNTAGFRLSAEA